MKDPFDRTKVVLRHLPPAIPQPALMEQIDGRFSGCYDWACFRPGKNNPNALCSQKNQQYSRLYIAFKRPEDVVEFAEFFDGHIFVNEKGSQFKALVEYAPSQRVPKPCSKKDGREGTIFKDPEYLEYLEHVSKPVENLPSAEIHLERREAERAGAAKDTIIVTPLMDFVRQKRAAKSEFQRSSGGKFSRRSGVVLANNCRSSKRGPEKRRGPTSVYVARDNRKNGGGKDKSTFMLVQRGGEQQAPEKSAPVASLSGADVIQNETANIVDGSISGTSGAVENGNRRILLLKGKPREDPYVFDGSSQQSNVLSSVRNSSGSAAVKQNQQPETSGRTIRTIFSYKGGRRSSSSTAASQSEQLHTLILEEDKPSPQHSTACPISRDQSCSRPLPASAYASDSKIYFDDNVASNDQHGSVPFIERSDRRTRNKDRPDRGVWTLRRSDRSRTREGTPSELGHMLSGPLQGASSSQHAAELESGVVRFPSAHAGYDNNSQAAYDMPLGHSELKSDVIITSKSAEIRNIGGGRVGLSSVENGSRRHVGRHGAVPISKEVNSSLNIAEMKASKRGPTGYGSNERRVWIQKSGSAS